MPEYDQDTVTEVFEFRLSGALNPPRAVNFTTKELREQVVDGIINLNPDYQRGVVWSVQKQVGLIDSIFKNFYVPPIILAVKHEEDGTESKVCIDGKQRLTAIQRFIDGTIHYFDTETKAKLYYFDKKDDHTKKKRLLPDRYRKIFASRQIVCVEYSGLEESQIRDMFQRVQAGMTLNTAERMQAIEGPMTDFIKTLDKTYFIDNQRHLGMKLTMNDRRNVTFHNIAQFLWMFDRWPDRMASPTVRELHDWLVKSRGPSTSLFQKAHDVFKFFLQLVDDGRYLHRIKRVETFAPVEFIYSSLLIAFYKDQLKLEGVSRAIQLMRSEARLLYPGQTRTNKLCCSLMAAFITNLTWAKMESKAEELVVVEKLRREEAERQDGDRKKLKRVVEDQALEGDDEGHDDEDADIDFTTPEFSNKKARIQH